MRDIRILDFGSNAKLKFHRKLEESNAELILADIDYEFDKSHNAKKFDIISSYYVFEHLINLKEIMKNFSNVLSKNGIIIIEVPDINKYDKDYSGLIFEHQQHFSRDSLKRLMSLFNFAEIFYSNKLQSRKFGFVSAFKSCVTNKLTKVIIIN